MGLLSLLLLAIATGVVLVVAELMLPTHGILGLLGVGCFAVGLVVIFIQNKWAGLGVFLGAIILSPLIWAAIIRLWTVSPIGKRVILQPLQARDQSASVTLGEVGTAATTLRPMGECDFGPRRIEVMAELGIVEPGTRVKVVSMNNGRPTVRPITT